MAFNERLRSAVYESPSGAVFTLQFEEVERSGGKKAAIHEFPQQDKSDIQDLGNQGEKFPMSVFFTGEDADEQASDFWSALSERGPGVLQHPRYGNIPVLPLTWSQKENVVERLGRQDFQIEFVRVYEDLPFPITSVSISESVTADTANAMAEGDAAAGEQFEPENAADAEAISEDLTTKTESWGEAFAEIVASSEELATEFNKAVRDFGDKIDEYIGMPASMFSALTRIANLPAKAVTNISRKLTAYRDQVIAAAASVPASYSQAVASVQALFGLCSGASVASTIGTLKSRSDAISAADLLGSIYDSLISGVELAETSVDGFHPSSETLASLIDSISSARNSLQERAYSLKAERHIILASERTPLDLVSELYGSIDQLDDFIESNNLEDDEILLIPKGREVLFYA